MQVLENKALLINVKKPERYTATIDECVYLGEVSTGLHQIVVRWTYDNVQALAKLGLKRVPSVILRDYKWSGRFTPMAHQKDTAGFIVNHEKCFVLSEQGTGKSASAAWAIDYLLQQKKINRVLVVCPLSVMKAAWVADLFQVAPHRSVGIAYGSPKARREVIQGKYEIVIINYDGLEIVIDELKAAEFDMIVADEANALKNTQTKRWKFFKQLVNQDTRLVLMTGTPAAQSPEDAYGLAKLVCPQNIPNFANGWKDLVMQKISMFKWIPRPKATSIVFNALQPAIRYTKEECLDLPDIVYIKRDVPLTAQQQKYYDILRKQLLVETAGEEISAVNAAAKLNKLLQISSGNIYSDDGTVVQFDVSNRLAEVEAIIDESLHKVIIFAPFTHTIDMLNDYLTKKKIKCDVINGSVSANKRAKVIEDFQNNNSLRVVIIQPQAAAHGITLTAADTVIWFGPTSSVETYLQANARAHRKGQTNKVTVYLIQGSPAEEKMYNLLNTNVTNHMQLVELYNAVLKD